MKKIKENNGGVWKKIFIGLGIVFATLLVLILIAILYISIKKPFDVDITKIPAAVMGRDDVAESSYDHPALSAEQEIFLETIGVDTEVLPTSISAEQEACAVEKLGQARVDEIKAGADLKTSDYLKAGGCFQ